MSSSTTLISGELALYESQAQQNTLSQAILVSSTTIHFYYTALHFDEEVEYIWSKKWTAGKVMYLLTRYSGALFLLYAAAGVSAVPWNWPMFDTIHYAVFQATCLYGYLYVGPGAMIVLIAEIILQMRVYALYGRRKKMLILFILLTFALFAFNIVQTSGLPQTAGQKLCIGSVCHNGKRFVRGQEGADEICTNQATTMSAIGWLVTSVVELLLFALVLWKTRQVRKDNAIQTSSLVPVPPKMQNRDITSIMARDSTVYFAVIFTVCLIGTGLAFFTEVNLLEADFSDLDSMFLAQGFIGTQMNAYQAATIAIMTILAPKLLINLRAEYYGPVGILTEKSQLTWDVVEPRRVATSGGTDEYMDVETVP